MQLRVEDGLLLAEATFAYAGQVAALPRVLIDTGSAGTLLSAEAAQNIGMAPELTDEVRRIQGVGGSELVWLKALESFAVGPLTAADFVVEVGKSVYGRFGFDAIVGLDFLQATRAVVDIANLQLHEAE